MRRVLAVGVRELGLALASKEGDLELDWWVSIIHLLVVRSWRLLELGLGLGLVPLGLWGLVLCILVTLLRAFIGVTVT